MHRPAEPGDRLRQSIEQGTAVIGIVGMGYVGLPLMLAVTAKDYRVLGFDIDAPKVEGLNRGRSPLKHIGDTVIEKVVAAGRFEATADLSRFGEADIVIICVPTPLGPHQEPDLSFVIETTRSIAKCLRRGQLVVLESTTYPGTTEEIVRPILEAGGMRSGVDFFLAFSPEREDPGNADFTTHAFRKSLAATDALALQLATAFYRRVVTAWSRFRRCKRPRRSRSLENIFRAVNIALVNELKLVFTRMGIDIFEVDRCGQDEAFRLHAVLSGARPRRTLHPDRPVLSDVEGARIRHRYALHRACGRDQFDHARLRRPAHSPRCSTAAPARACRKRAC